MSTVLEEEQLKDELKQQSSSTTALKTEINKAASVL